MSTLRGGSASRFSSPGLYALSVRENMTAYADADDARLKSCLEGVGLRLSLDAQVTKEFDENGAVLSGGDAQRLCLTRLLHSEFGLLILDEPSSALDPDRRVPHCKADLRPLADDHRYGRAPALHGRGRGPNLSSLRWKNHRIRHARGADGAERKISGNVFKAGRRVLESLAEVWYNKSKFFLSREGSLPALLK